MALDTLQKPTLATGPTVHHDYSLRSTPRRQAAATTSEYEQVEGAPLLGSGGYGTVLRARHRASGVVVAAKVVSLGTSHADTVRNEVTLLQQLVHPNIIGLRGYEELGGCAAIYMELCETDLFHHVRAAGQLSEDVARSYASQMVAALDFMHSAGVAHRDLKLENVLIGADGRCKLCDFGLALAFESPKSAEGRWLEEICGSKSYCAPEVLVGSGYDGFAADVWSCGICIFAMVAGFFPLDEAAPSDWRYERLKIAASSRTSLTHAIFGFYELPCALSPEGAELIDGMLSLTPIGRLSASSAAQAAWLSASFGGRGGGSGGGGGAMMEVDVTDALSASSTHALGSTCADIGNTCGANTVATGAEKLSPPLYRSGGGHRIANRPPALERQKPKGFDEESALSAERAQAMLSEALAPHTRSSGGDSGGVTRKDGAEKSCLCS